MTTIPPPRPWSRRGFLVATGGALTAGVLAACTEAAPASSSATTGMAGHSMDGMPGMDPGGALDAQALTTPGSVGFVEPAVRSSTGGRLATTLRMAKTPVTIGTQTVQAVTYEASYPAPTLEIRPGDTLAVRLVNDGDEETNLHTHGLHVSPSGNSDNVLLDIKAGQRFDYSYAIPKDHPGGTLWYHPHMHMLADKQVFGGMFGLLIVRGDFDQLPGIAGLPERVMMLSQIDIANSEIVDGDDSSLSDQVTLVNGQYQPTLDIAPGEIQRWRVCNSSSVFYRLRLQGQPLTLVNVDGNSLTETTAHDVLIVPPGGRIDVLVRGGDAGEYAFESMSWDDLGPYYTANMVPTKGQALVRLVAKPAAKAVTAAAMPTTLLPMDDLRTASIDRRREFRLEEREPRGSGQNDKFQYYINGTQFDHNVVNETMKLGATEEWEFVNLTYEPHPIHIHVNPFQVVSVNGEPSGDNHYRDSVMLPPFGRIVLRHRFLDFTGKFVMHCHILFHEDHGMMQLLEVVA
jgi:FtsP/CotA-like multicopper oxidase with cupredoxin domain